MLIGCVIDDEIDHDADAALARGAEEIHEVPQGAEAWIHVVIVGDVVPIVPVRRRMKREQPHARNAERVEVVDSRGETRKVADAVAVGILKRLDVERVDDGILVPEVAWSDELGAVNAEPPR